jgi:hypothetical protein
VDGSWGVAENWDGSVVPAGTAFVAFTNGHTGTVTVTLDGDRSQTGGLLFGGGDWSVQPGAPGTSVLTLGGTITNLDGVATLGVSGGTSGGGKVIKRGSGEWVIAAERTFVNTPSVEEGVLRVAPGGVIRTGATWDTFVDGTGTLLVDGGRVETKIIRLGQDVMSDGALFRMTSGTVNCGGSGDASLLIGYQSGTPLQGSATAEILGGTFTATGVVSNAGIFIGSQQPGTLVVAGTNGVPTAMDVGRIWFGWKDATRNFATTNVFVIESNAVVSASVAVLKQMPLCRGDLYLRSGGTLRTPTVYAVAGPLAFHFEGGTLEMTAPSNTLFAGPGVSVSVDADSEVDIGTNAVLMTPPLTGAATLTKTGSGTLCLGGDQTGFAGTLAVQAGVLALTNLTGGADLNVRLEQDTALDLAAVATFVGGVTVSGDAAVTAASGGVTVSYLTLESGTLTLPDNDFLTVLALNVPMGADVTISCAGTVAIGSLTGGGTLTGAGGGTFAVVDDSGFAGSVSAEPGTTLKVGATSISRLTVSGDQTLSTAGGTVTVDELTLAGGKLTVSGGGELALGTVSVTDGAEAGFALADGSVVTNIAALTLGAGCVFEPQVEAGDTLTLTSVNGTGTLRLEGGAVMIAALATDVSFDIVDGTVEAQPVAGPGTVTYTSGEPAFWVDASEAGSLEVVGGKLEWRDRRYNEAGPYDMKATAIGVQPTVVASDPELNGLGVVRFAYPSSTPYKGMEWSRRLTEIRTVFWVIGAQEGGGGLLGDEALIDYLRGEVPPGTGFDVPLNIYYAPLFSLKFANANRDNIRNVQNGVTRINGQATDAFRNGFPSPDYHVVSLRTAGNTVAQAFASERISGSDAFTIRSGCQRLAEAIVFTNALTDAEIAETEAYLQAKWFGSAVRARAVRIGGSGARFTAVGGEVMIDELRMDAPGLSPTNALSGVERIERLVMSAAGVALGDAAQTGLPYDVGELRVENGVTVTVDTSAAGAVWLSLLSGTGTVTVAGGTSVEVGGVRTLTGDDLTVETPSVPVTVRAWESGGALRVAGASALAVNSADLSGSSVLAVSGGTEVPFIAGEIRVTGAWAVSGSVSASVGTLRPYGSGLGLLLATGGLNMQVYTLYGRGTLTRTGTGFLTIRAQVIAEDTTFTCSADTFEGLVPRVNLRNGNLSVTGEGPVLLRELRTETGTALNLSLAAGVSMTVSNLNHTAGTLTLPTSGTLEIVNLTPSGDRAVVFPSGATTTVRQLATTTSGRVVLQGGTLRVLDSITNVGRFAILNEGLILPDGTILAPVIFDVRSDARIDLGVGSVLTLNVAELTFSNDVTFVQGTVQVTENLTVPGTLRLEGTAVSVAAGRSLAAGELTGDGEVAVAAGGTLTVTDIHGFDGVIDNAGGTLNVSNDRINEVPVTPVVVPTFWVDASESGSLTTNAQNKLVWLDKRTVRDGTPGLMYAVSSNMPTILQGELNGLPVVDFGPLGTSATDERGMTWSARLTDVRAVHWVIGVQNGGGQMLGDYKGGHIDYFRYSDQYTGIYTNNYGYGDYRTPLWSGTRFYTRELQKNIVDGTTYMDGVQMAAPGFTDGFPSPDYHLLSLRTAGPTWAAAFASERVGQAYGTRSGAQRLGEVLAYNAVSLTEAQNRGNDAYLSWKWFARLLPTYRSADSDLIVLRGSGAVSGSSVLARELAPAAAGLTLDGDLYLDYYSDAAETGTVIRLDALPAAGVAAVGVAGDIALAARGTVVLGEVRAGRFTVLEAGGTLNGAANIADWRVDVSSVPNAVGYTIELVVEGEAVVLKIAARGTLILLH